MELLAPGHVVDGSYRVDKLLHESPRATIYAVTHLRFGGSPLALKVVPLERAGDFERDTNALAILTTPAVAHVCDRGVLPDGRPYRVVERLTGPPLVQALKTSAFTEDRVSELLVDLAAAVFEARGNGIGPCDLSAENLVFAAEGSRRLCLLRALKDGARMPDPEADEAALVALRGTLERGRESALTKAWRPPLSIEELRRAKSDTGGAVAEPGAAFPGNWRVVQRRSETLHSTIYSVVGAGDVRGMLRHAGPNADRAKFMQEAQLLARVRNRCVVRVHHVGTHEGEPFYVMDFLRGRSLEQRLAEVGKLPIDRALAIVLDLLEGAEAIAKTGGGPADLSLGHCYESETADGHPIVLTRTTAKEGRFMMYGSGQDSPQHMDAWSAAVAFYELVAGRSPFPLTRRSMMQAWLGVPTPLAQRRNDVPPEISLVINNLIANAVTLTRRELRAQLLEWRAGLTNPGPPDRMSIEPPMAAPPAVAPTTALSPGHVVVVPPVRAIVASSSPADPPRRVATPLAVHPDAPPPLDWKLEVAPARCPIAPLQAAAIRADEVVAVSRDAVARFRRGAWSVDPAREIGRVGRIVPIGAHDYLALTSDRRLFRLGVTGGFVPWGPTLARFAFFGVAPFDDGRDSAYLVGGSTDWGRGMVARLDGESLTIVAEDAGVHTLFAVATVPDRSLIAVGARGSIARLRGGAVIETGFACEEDLYTVGVLGGDILVTGARARIFRVKTASLGVDVEPADTTQDLTCLATHESGQAWAGSDHGRILRRRNGHHWRRMHHPFPGDPGIVAMHVTATSMRAVLKDGTLVVGQPLATPAS